MNPIDTTSLAHERIADLIRDSADTHRGPDRPARFAGISAVVTGARRRLAELRTTAVSLLAVLRLTERT